MKVHELIKYLRTVNKNADVSVVVDDGKATLRIKLAPKTAGGKTFVHDKTIGRQAT